MFKQSSGPDKSSVIHSTVKETLEHTYGDIVNSVDEKIFTQFHSLLLKTPVVFVSDQIPTDVLEWYKRYVFSQDKPKLSQGPVEPSKDQCKSIDNPFKEPLRPVSKPKTPIKSRNEPPKDTIKSTRGSPSKPDVNTTKLFAKETQLSQKDPQQLPQPVARNERLDSPVAPVPNYEIVGMDVEESKGVELRNLGTNQSVTQLPVGSSVQSIAKENNQAKDDQQTASIITGSHSNQSNQSTKFYSNTPDLTTSKGIESTAMEIDESKGLTGDPLASHSSNGAINQLSNSNQPPRESLGPRIEANLQLSEESSNESITLDPSIEGLNSDTVEDLITAVLKTIAEDNASTMELEESQRLSDALSSFEAVQSMDQSLDSSMEQAIEEAIKPPSPPPPPPPPEAEADPNQSSLQLSEESSNDSMSLDKDTRTDDDQLKMDEDVNDDKRDALNDDKMQNIKFNSNVLAAIEDENNLLDFEDI